MPVDTPWPRHYVSADTIRYLTECRRTDNDETKGWADIQFAKQRAPAHRVPYVEKVSMAMGGKKSWRKAGRIRPALLEYRPRRAWGNQAKKQAYYMPRVMPYSRSTDVVWQHYEPWPAQHWGGVPYSALTAGSGVRYAPW